MDNSQTLQAWLEQNPGPWVLTMWTYAKDGRPPGEVSAGYISGRVDAWETSDGVLRFWAKDNSSNFALITQAIGKVEEVVSEGLKIARFAYVNFKTEAAGFIPYIIFTINHCD